MEALLLLPVILGAILVALKSFSALWSYQKLRAQCELTLRTEILKSEYPSGPRICADLIRATLRESNQQLKILGCLHFSENDLHRLELRVHAPLIPSLLISCSYPKPRSETNNARI